MCGQIRGRESAENYLKTILLLREELGEVRSVDVAHALGVSKPSVCNAVKKLRDEGLVVMDEKHSLVLTKTGLETAVDVFERHATLEKFLTTVLKLDKKTAHSDSCRLEHLASAEMLEKMKELCNSRQ